MIIKTKWPVSLVTFIAGILSLVSYVEAQDNVNYSIIFKGECQMELVRGAGLGPCNATAQLLNTRNHISIIKFSTIEGINFYLKGGKDRQPNLENYYLNVDTMIIEKTDGKITQDTNMEGECHFVSNKEASEFFSIRCDIYDRRRGIGGRFYLDPVTNTVINQQ